MTLNPRWPGIASRIIGVATQKRHDGRNETNHVIFFEAPTPLRFRPSSDPAGSSPTVPPDAIRAAATADAVSATRDPPPVAPAPSNCRDGAGLERLVFRAGGSLKVKRASGGRRDITFAFGPSVVSDIIDNEYARAARSPSAMRLPRAPSQPRSSRRPAAPVPSLDVHLGEVGDGMVERVGAGDVDGLLRLHRRLHHRVVRLERVNVVLGRGEDRAVVLDALAQAVLRHLGDDLPAVLFLGHHPARALVQRRGRRRAELVDLHHRLADGGARLLDLGDERGIVEDAARDLAVPASEAQH
mmetsp:Transcript_4422/g.17647  ORF Transcript_4422/g.17647 Transcript_4422/m.17647 type:complete len:299 (-) Transcript_4422:50-946(-)